MLSLARRTRRGVARPELGQVAEQARAERRDEQQGAEREQGDEQREVDPSSDGQGPPDGEWRTITTVADRLNPRTSLS